MKLTIDNACRAKDIVDSKKAEETVLLMLEVVNRINYKHFAIYVM